MQKVCFCVKLGQCATTDLRPVTFSRTPTAHWNFVLRVLAFQPCTVSRPYTNSTSGPLARPGPHNPRSSLSGQTTSPCYRSATSAALEHFMELAVCGLHMTGLPLNSQLTELGAVKIKSCKSAANYELYSFTDLASGVEKPGMIYVPGSNRGTAEIELEVWQLPLEQFGPFLSKVQAPLGIGTVRLADGTSVKGFICEGYVAAQCRAGVDGVRNITHFGSWPAYLASKQQSV